MKIKEFSYMSNQEINDTKWKAWSRVYEYPFVLDFLNKLIPYKPDISIHNTGCGGGDIHLQFANELEKYGKVINSDIDSIRGEGKPNNYVIWNILTKPNFKADIVICVSILEHLDNQVLALQNLLDGVNDGGFLIITLDSPSVNLIEIEKYLGVNCKDVENRLDPKNSICKHYMREGLNIVKLIIQK